MFKVKFFDQFGNEIEDCIFILYKLPDIGQLINIDKRGIYDVCSVMLSIGKNIETIYAVVVKAHKPPIGNTVDYSN